MYPCHFVSNRQALRVHTQEPHIISATHIFEVVKAGQICPQVTCCGDNGFVGYGEGELVGADVGLGDGFAVGTGVGFVVGLFVGLFVGPCVGATVGATVGLEFVLGVVGT